MSVTRAETVAQPLRASGTRELRRAVGRSVDSQPYWSSSVMADELVMTQVSAVRIASRRVTGEHMQALRDSVERASRIPAAVPWERKAAAHAEFFNVLADVMGDDLVAPVLHNGAKVDHDLMAAAGRQAEGMIAGSRNRFLDYIEAGDTDAAALEMEKHLCVLHYMWQLADWGAHRASA